MHTIVHPRARAHVHPLTRIARACSVCARHGQVTRRYKIMNPEKMRDTYGKMVYLLQDANSAEMVEELGFELVAPIRTVHAKLKECGALDLLADEHIATATQVDPLTPNPNPTPDPTPDS